MQSTPPWSFDSAMPISRRTLIERLSLGAAAAVTAPRFAAAAAALDARTPGAPIRLNRNENAYGPSPNVVAAMRETAHDAASRYPDVDAAALQRKIADVHGVAPEQVVLGCGSGEILRMAVDAFAGPRKPVVAARPTFEWIGGCAQRVRAGMLSVPLKEDYSHDLPAMLAQAGAEAGLVYICNPNNPTGTLTPRREIEAFLRRLPERIVVLIDEAYHEYVGELPHDASFVDRRIDDERVVVARSFSKIHALAGLRVGYAVTAERTARALAAHRLSDGVNVVAARAAAAALDDREHVLLSVSRNADDRQEFLNQANARMLRSIDSLTNFVMLHTARPAAEAVEHLGKHHILVSPPIPGFEMYIRVSLGTPGAMREFWRVWDLMPHKMSM